MGIRQFTVVIILILGFSPGTFAGVAEKNITSFKGEAFLIYFIIIFIYLLIDVTFIG